MISKLTGGSIMFCDLHIHSVFSDGSATLSEIVDQAQAAGLSAIALTDHNTVDGLPDFIEAARKKNIEPTPGIEFSVDYNDRELHLLGLFVKPEYFSQISELMRGVMQRKEESNIALIDSLKRIGYALDYEEIRASTPSGKINRAHIAMAMVQKGYISSVKEGFNTLLSKSAGYYVEPERLGVAQVIDFINSIGAVSVLAHPFLNLNEQELVEFLRTTRGLCGMECYYSSYDEKTTERALRIAESFDLLCSGGSDFHGSAKPDISLGDVKVPYECYLALRARAK